MVDGVLLLVDASEGPLPQTRFVLRKALDAQLPVVLVVNKVDRPDARIAEVVDETYELFLDLDADRGADRVPDRLLPGPGRPGLADPPGRRRSRRTAPNLEPLFDTLLATDPGAGVRPTGAPLQAHVTNLDASPYLGRLALCRVHNGTIRKGQQVAWCRTDGTIERVKVTELLMTEALDRVPVDEAGPGDLIAVAGIPDITIGETLADPDDPRPLPLITVDEPAISMTHRHQHLAAGRAERHQAHRPAGEEPARRRAGRQRLDPGAADRAAGHLGGAGPRRAAAGRAGRDHAPGGLRADRRQAAGGHPGGRRQGARADGAADHRRPRGVPRRRHPAARAAQGPAGADGQPRHRLGPAGVPRARPAG